MSFAQILLFFSIPAFAWPFQAGEKNPYMGSIWSTVFSRYLIDFRFKDYSELSENFVLKFSNWIRIQKLLYDKGIFVGSKGWIKEIEYTYYK